MPKALMLDSYKDEKGRAAAANSIASNRLLGLDMAHIAVWRAKGLSHALVIVRYALPEPLNARQASDA